MTDDEKLTKANEEPTPPEAPLEEVQSPEKTVRDARPTPIETIPEEVVPEEIKALEDAETPDSREARREAEAALNKPIEAIESAIERIDEQPSQSIVQAEIQHHADEPIVIKFGERTLTFNTNIYTFVFGILGLLTIFEVIVAELLPDGLIRTLILVGASLVKAVLVMAFYMHLREDNKLFAAAIALPLIIVSIAMLFLLSVDPVAYPYQ